MISEQKHIAFIGGGNMAQAIVFGLLNKGYEPSKITVCDPNEEKRALFAAQQVETKLTQEEAVKQAEVVLLAVKPQVLAEACKAFQHLDLSNKIIISIAAAISLKILTALLPSAREIIRVMPNTPALVGEGMAGLFANSNVTQQAKDFAESLLNAVGKTCWLEKEEQMHLLTAGSGSSPAYFFLIFEAMEEALIKQGLNADIARELVQQSALGAAKIAQQNPQTPFNQLRQNVTSKGGTTAAAIAVFQQQQFEQTVEQAIQACIVRSQEMETLF